MIIWGKESCDSTWFSLWYFALFLRWNGGRFDRWVIFSHDYAGKELLKSHNGCLRYCSWAKQPPRYLEKGRPSKLISSFYTQRVGVYFLFNFLLNLLFFNILQIWLDRFMLHNLLDHHCDDHSSLDSLSLLETRPQQPFNLISILRFF